MLRLSPAHKNKQQHKKNDNETKRYLSLIYILFFLCLLYYVLTNQLIITFWIDDLDILW